MKKPIRVVHDGHLFVARLRIGLEECQQGLTASLAVKRVVLAAKMRLEEYEKSAIAALQKKGGKKKKLF